MVEPEELDDTARSLREEVRQEIDPDASSIRQAMGQALLGLRLVFEPGGAYNCRQLYLSNYGGDLLWWQR